MNLKSVKSGIGKIKKEYITIDKRHYPYVYSSWIIKYFVLSHGYLNKGVKKETPTLL